MYNLTQEMKEKIANNIIDFMSNDTQLIKETTIFISDWVMRTVGKRKTQSMCDVWDIVLTKYLPQERPILFRSCRRVSDGKIQSFTGRISAAERFSDHHTGHLLICDTNEYLQFEDEKSVVHRRSFFPLCEFIKKGANHSEQFFSKWFYESYKGEDEYIVRVEQDWLYDLKWVKVK